MLGFLIVWIVSFYNLPTAESLAVLGASYVF